MSNDLGLQELLSLYEKQRSQAIEQQQKLEEMTVSVTAPKRVVTVEVGSHGQLTAIKFPTDAYRSMAPTELSSLVMKTFERARSKATAEVEKLLEGVSAGQFSAADVHNRKVAMEDLLPENIFDENLISSLFGGPLFGNGGRT